MSTTKTTLRAQLLMKGLTLSGFARKHGFRPNTVIRVVGRHYNGGDQDMGPPRGKTTLAILGALKSELQPNEPQRAAGVAD